MMWIIAATTRRIRRTIKHTKALVKNIMHLAQNRNLTIDLDLAQKTGDASNQNEKVLGVKFCFWLLACTHPSVRS